MLRHLSGRSDLARRPCARPFATGLPALWRRTFRSSRRGAWLAIRVPHLDMAHCSPFSSCSPFGEGCANLRVEVGLLAADRLEQWPLPILQPLEGFRRRATLDDVDDAAGPHRPAFDRLAGHASGCASGDGTRHRHPRSAPRARRTPGAWHACTPRTSPWPSPCRDASSASPNASTVWLDPSALLTRSNATLSATPTSSRSPSPTRSAPSARAPAAARTACAWPAAATAG